MNTNELVKHDPPRVNVQTALIGALYGFLMATAFVLVAAFIDTWLYPDIPFGIDWELAFRRWAMLGLGMVLVGAMTCLFTESFYGLLAGTVTAALLTLTTALYLTSLSGGAKIIGLVFTLAPVAVMSLPVSMTIRRLTENHARAQHAKWTAPRILTLVLIAVTLGSAAGYFMKISKDALMALEMVHTNLQAAPQDQKREFREVAGLEEHRGMSYSLSERASTATTTGYDVWAEYEDGYIVKCVVVVYPGTPPYILSCEPIQ
jgi:hypothetical protein